MRDRQQKWDRANLRTISTHLPREMAENLKILCKNRGITPYMLLRNYLLKVLQGEE